MDYLRRVDEPVEGQRKWYEPLVRIREYAKRLPLNFYIGILGTIAILSVGIIGASRVERKFDAGIAKINRQIYELAAKIDSTNKVLSGVIDAMDLPLEERTKRKKELEAMLGLESLTTDSSQDTPQLNSAQESEIEPYQLEFTLTYPQK